MEKIFSKAKAMIILVVMISGIMFFLQSCCCLGSARSSTQTKFCDCNKKNMAYKQGNKERKDIGNTSQVTTDASRVVDKTEPPGNVYALAAISPEPVEESVATVVTEPGEPFIVAVREVISSEILSGEMKLAEKKRSTGLIKMKKLPLGIKGMNTHIIAGPSMSFKSSKEDYGGTDHKSKAGLGFQFGIKSTFTFSEKFDVSSALILKKNTAGEVLSYPTTGEPGSGSTQKYESKYNYTYLSVPLMAEVKLSDRFTAMAGPEVNLLMGANVKTSGYGETEKTDIKDNSVKTGFGLQAGVKYEIPGSPLIVQLIYDHRISRLNEKSSEYYPGGGYETPAWKMKSVQIGIACSICSLLTGNK
jgi:hypothetical protein